MGAKKTCKEFPQKQRSVNCYKNISACRRQLKTHYFSLAFNVGYFCVADLWNASALRTANTRNDDDDDDDDA